MACVQFESENLESAEIRDQRTYIHIQKFTIPETEIPPNIVQFALTVTPSDLLKTKNDI